MYNLRSMCQLYSIKHRSDNIYLIFSDYVLDNINELGLLFWFLDDGQWHVSFKGNKAKRFGYLNTQSFTYEENQKIVKMFGGNLMIKSNVGKVNSARVCQILIDNFDIDGADEAMTQLDTYKFKEECEPLLDELRTYVADVAMEDIMTTVDRLKEYIL